MSKLSRRETLARGGQAVAAAAVLSVAAKAALASEGEDSKLLSRVENFWAVHKEANDGAEKWHVEYERVHALPEFPPYTDKAYRAFFDEHTNHALFDISNKANKRQGRAVKAVFDIPAKTYRGVLAKLKILEVAYGTGCEDGDMDLEVYQDHETPWLENAIGDFERLAGRAI